MMKQCLMFVTVVLFAVLAGTAGAGVNVNINIGTPMPALVLAQPPALAVVPGTYVYVAPEVSADLVFFQDNWYRPHGGQWYVSISYNGPWKVVAAPPAIMSLPPNYRTLPSSHDHMPYGQVKDNWRTWERNRHWDHEARRDDHGEDRGKEHHGKHNSKKHHDHDDHDRGRGKNKHDD